METRNLRFTTAHHIMIVLLIVVIQGIGLFLIFNEAQQQAREVQLDILRSQVDASARSLDLFFDSLEDALRTSVVTGPDGTLNVQETLQVLSRRRLQPSVVSRFIRTIDRRVISTARVGSPISPDRVQELVTTAHRRDRHGYDLVVPVVNPDERFAVATWGDSDGALIGAVIDLKAELTESFAPVEIGAAGSIWAMDETGTVLYDVEPEIVGSSVLDLHTEYPSLLEIDRRILNEPAGTGAYRFIHRATGEPQEKVTAWRHVTTGGSTIAVVLSASEQEVTAGLGTLLVQVVVMITASLIILITYAVISFRRERAREKDEERRLQTLVEERTREAQARETHYRTLFETAGDAVVLADPTTGEIVDVNTAATSMMQMGRDALIGKPSVDLHPPEERERVMDAFTHAENIVGVQRYHGYHIMTAQGDLVPVEISTSVVSIDGRGYAYGIFHDVTERERIERELRNIADERAHLVKEVVHRTKNNLTMVASLLSIQASSSDDPTIAAAFQSATDRVRTLAEVQEILTQTGDASTVHADAYIGGIAQRLVATYAPDDRAITLDARIPRVALPVRTGVNLGLIVNELITNSMKYAFSGRPAGVVTVELTERADAFELVVADDGVGFNATGTVFAGSQEGEVPPAPDTTGSGRDAAPTQAPSHGSLGFTLVQNIAQQIDATVTLDTGADGTRWTIRFPGKDLKLT